MCLLHECQRVRSENAFVFNSLVVAFELHRLLLAFHTFAFEWTMIHAVLRRNGVVVFGIPSGMSITLICGAKFSSFFMRRHHPRAQMAVMLGFMTMGLDCRIYLTT